MFIIKFTSTADCRSPFHWHKEMEWIWVEKGSLELTLGTQRKILQKQDFVMINSYELHQLRSIGNTSSIHHALVFLPDMLAFSYPDHCQISYIEPLLSRQLLLPSFCQKICLVYHLFVALFRNFWFFMIPGLPAGSYF
ncbi:MAG: cupin domain-containing protein [Lachnospiraceae bacterium]